MFTLLFTTSPSTDPEASIEGYMAQTRDIHWLVISHALAKLRDTKVCEYGQLVPRRWAPSVPEIRHECARIIRREIRRAQGKDPEGYSPHAAHELHEGAVERWIARGPELVQRLPALGSSRRAVRELEAAARRP